MTIELDPAQAAIAWTTALLLGVLIGRYTERHKETTMQLSARARGWYDRWAPVFVVAVALLALIGIWIGTAATFANGRQDAERAAEAAARDSQTRDLLACFDDYAAAQSASSGAVREASVVKDRATSRRDTAFSDVLNALLTEEQDQQQVRTLFERLSRANAALVDAQAALDTARAENPVPDPPSEFCSVEP